jgi:CubicO group peptidase (beta-lactamase class C family)
MPAGGLFSTATDLSIFYRMIAQGGTFAGKRYLSEHSLKEMTTKQTGDLATSYGFGFATGGGEIGHGGAYNTHSSFHPEQQLITIFLVQHPGWKGKEGKTILRAFQQAAIGAYGAKPSPQPAAAAAATPAAPK